ncbi:hypothetical protein MTDSW087_05772 [Methylobacterium dankookense]|uniref:Uncharacterized protein n=1 Tax=Methylobacterium dankookense TaxID=560405 RepID=A0A564G643_9HYPH|nr:hypothetical protein IFDJLNFL_5227 [Methylobacterium dankookense]VUF16023.1 hypothetical protein MTDSW087_05772 [Methylobacterium dankookense]
MTCPPVEQDLSAVWCGIALLVGIILGMSLKQPPEPPNA